MWPPTFSYALVVASCTGRTTKPLFIKFISNSNSLFVVKWWNGNHGFTNWNFNPIFSRIFVSAIFDQKKPISGSSRARYSAPYHLLCYFGPDINRTLCYECTVQKLDWNLHFWASFRLVLISSNVNIRIFEYSKVFEYSKNFEYSSVRSKTLIFSKL